MAWLTDRRAVHKVVDIIEGHGEGGEGQHHALVHIALLEAVAPSSAPAASAPQLICTAHRELLHIQANPDACRSNLPTTNAANALVAAGTKVKQHLLL